MFNVTKLIHLAPDADSHVLLANLRSAADATAAMHTLVEPTLPGARNGGDVLVHLRFAKPDDWAAALPRFNNVLADGAVVHVDGAEYRGTPEQHGAGRPPGTVYRALLLRVAPETADAVVERFETDLRLMPRYVRTITAWQLSRVDSAIGSSPWTHVFEQEFTDVEGLMGPYLMHPIHWAYVDRWFDPECPEVIVRDRVCHSFCPCEAAVLGG